MGVSKQDLTTHSVFHYEPACTEKRTERWRRNGGLKTWKTRPNEFRLPVKFGLRDYSYITEENANEFHTAQDCPHGHS